MALSEIQRWGKPRFMGGTDLAKIVGADPWAGPFAVQQAKLGRYVPEDAGEAAEWGNRLEPAIAQAYADREGVEVVFARTTIWGPEPWMGGNPDIYVVGQRVGADIKTTSAHNAHLWGREDSQEFPLRVKIQCHWYLELTGWERWDVPVLIGGNDFRIYRVYRDEAFQAALVEAGRRFWFDHVVQQLPIHEPTWLRATRSVLDYANAQSIEGKVRVAGELEQRLAFAFAELDELAKRARDEADYYKDQLKELIGSSEELRGEGWRILWRSGEAKEEVDWEALVRELPKELVKPLIQKYTTVKVPTRRFIPNWKWTPKQPVYLPGE